MVQNIDASLLICPGPAGDLPAFSLLYRLKTSFRTVGHFISNIISHQEKEYKYVAYKYTPVNLPKCPVEAIYE